MTQRERLEGLLDRWARRLAARSGQTARIYRWDVEQFLGALGSKRLNAAAVERWIDSLAGLAPATRAHRISAVRTFLRFAQIEGAIDRGPVDALVRPRVTVTSYGRYLDVDELRALLDAARSLGARHYATVAALWQTGCRISELSGARWLDLYRDPAGRLGLRLFGKGGKERAVAVPDDLFAALVELHGSDVLDASDAGSLIGGAYRRGSVSTRTLQRMVSEAVTAAGLSKAASPHWLRHSHLTHAAANGASVFQIQAQAGHSDISTSQRYIHLATGLADSTADKLPTLF